MPAPILVQSAGTYFGSTPKGSITLSLNTTAGDMIKVYVFYNNTTTISITDSKSNAYTLQASYPIASNNFQNFAIYYNTNIAGGPLTVSVNLSPQAFAQMFVVEIAGQAASPNDGSTSATGTGTTASSGSITTTSPDLVFGIFDGVANPVFTPTGGFSTLNTFNSTNGLLASLSQSVAGSVAATATLSSHTWQAIVDAVAGTPATLNSIAVTPSPASLIAPRTQQFTATGTYSDSTQRNLTGASAWSSSNTGAAVIAAGGLATGVGGGTTTIQALLTGVSGTSTLTVFPNPYDAYLGLLAVPCTNGGNTAFSIDKTTYKNHPVFCTPTGHAYFARGFFGQDPSGGGQVDESGSNYTTYVTAKYGSTTNAGQQSLLKLQNWGMNNLPAFASSALWPSAGPQTVNTPFVFYFAGSEYAVQNKTINNSPGTGAVKDFTYYTGGSGATTTWGGQVPGSGMADWRDPNFVGTLNHVLANSQSATALASASAATKGYLLGFSLDESDGTHGLGATNDFATQPSGNNDFRLGYVSFFLPPVAWANSKLGLVYTDGKMYFKARMHDLLVTKYGNNPTVAGGTSGTAINTAWGSSYSTFLTGGTCFGPAMPSAVCASSGAAVSLSGSGTGPYTATLNTTVSKFSVYIALAGVVSGGDTGTGNIYGTGCGGMTGTINYATGALSVTCTTTPGAVTAGYIQNGWGIGSGFMDEDCRAGHSGYCGNGTSNTTIFLTGIPANVQTDINALSKDIANYYASTTKSTAQTWATNNGFVGNVLNLGPTTLGTWTTPPDKYVIQGVCGSFDAWMYGGQGTLSQAELDYIDQNCPGQPLIEGEYRTANAQSPFSWPNSACTHSGSSVTCTVATPNYFKQTIANSPTGATQSGFLVTITSTSSACYLVAGQSVTISGVGVAGYNGSWTIVTGCNGGNTFTYNAISSGLAASGGGTAAKTTNGISATCSDATWNMTNSGNYSYVSGALTYTATGSPAGTNATCNIFFDDSLVGGFASQALRAADFQAKASALPSRSYTASGTFPYVGYSWWQYNDNQSEVLNWGPLTVRDNNYDGVEDVNPIVNCSTPINTFSCGGELRGSYGGSAIPAIIATNASIDSFLTSLAQTFPVCNAPWTFV